MSGKSESFHQHVPEKVCCSGFYCWCWLMLIDLLALQALSLLGVDAEATARSKALRLLGVTEDDLLAMHEPCSYLNNKSAAHMNC